MFTPRVIFCQLLLGIIASLAGVLFVQYIHFAPSLSVHQWSPELKAAFKCCDAETIRNNKMPASVLNPAFNKSSSSAASQHSKGENMIFNYGRYHGVPDIDLHLPLAESFTGGFLQKVATLKEWSWSAVSNGDWFCGSAISNVQLGSGFFVYCLNTKAQEYFHSRHESLFWNLLGSAAGWGGRFVENPEEINNNSSSDKKYSGPSPMHGCAIWNYDENLAKASHCYSKARRRYEVKLRAYADFETDPVLMEVEYDFEFGVPNRTEALTIIYPFGDREQSERVGTSVKYAAAVVQNARILLKRPASESAIADIKWSRNVDEAKQDDEESALSKKPRPAPFSAILDYTRAMFPRHTTWFWVALSATVSASSSSSSSGRRIGMQLTTGGNAYVHGPNGEYSAESSIWLEGVAPGKISIYAIADCTITVVKQPPADKFSHPTYKVSFDQPNGDDSAVNFKLDLTFVRHGMHKQDFAEAGWPIMDGALLHQFGVYSGELTMRRGNKVVHVYKLENVGGVLEDHDTVW